MKKIMVLLVSMAIAFSLIGCQNEASLAGTYVGYSWKDEAKGVTFEEATEYIESEITLDKNGIITDAKLDFMVKKGTSWVSRADQNITVTVDFNVVPEIADARIDGRKEGKSMFTIQTVEFMSLFVVAVNSEGVVAFGMSDPITRYFMEVKLPTDFDYSTKMSQVTIENGLLTPTFLTSTASLVKPTTWDSLVTKNYFNISGWSHVITSNGPFKGISANSTVEAFLTKTGVTFVNGKPTTMNPQFGFFGVGGWKGNLEAIAAYLVGKDATTLGGIIDWSVERYALGIGEDNFFGIGDLPAGATKTVQNSLDGIAGASVRVSREATAIQRALVAAGLMTESEVVKGRF
jgi:hypothetical protein